MATHRTTFANDAVTTLMDRLLTSTDPKQQTTQFAYDAAGNLAALTDARNQTTSFSYDLRNQRTRKTYADGSHEDWTYDGDGKVQTYTTAAGKVLTMTYDNRDRLTLQDWSDTTPDVSQSYDAAGRLTDLQSPISDLRYTYDAANQLLSETQDLQAPVNLPAKTVSYSYDLDGNRAGMTYPGGTAMQFTYTGRHQLKEVLADGPPPLAGYTYDLAGNRTLKTLENGTSATYSYDDASRLLGLDHKQAGVSFQRFDYTLNNVSNRTARAETNGGVSKLDTYNYDPIDQLAQVKYSHDAAAGTQARLTDYTYDAAGNRQNVNEDADGSGPGVAAPTPYTANNLNQYTLIDSLAAPAYDANGNTTQLQTKLGDPAWTYQWDAQNRLISGSNGLTTFSFAYDARNRCTARTIGGVTKANYYDAWSLIEERTPADALQTYHLHGAGLDEILCTIREVSGTGVPTFHHHDGLGSVTALTSDLGALTERTTYDAYGLPAIFDPQGQPLAQSAQANRFLFTGREWLAELKLSDHRNRYYQPEVGRWLSPDPLGEKGGINLYGYVHNQPTLLTDPLGLAAGDWWDVRSYASVGSEMNPFNLSGSFAQTSLSIGDAMGGFLNGDDLTNIGNGSNGYKGLLEQTECDKGANSAVKGLLGVSGGAALGAAGVGTWGALGLPTFQAGVITSPNLHFFYGVTRGGATTWMHAAGTPGAMTTSSSAALGGFAGYYNTITGIPIIFPAAAAAVGIPATNCLTGACGALLRGLGF